MLDPVFLMRVLAASAVATILVLCAGKPGTERQQHQPAPAVAASR